MPTYEYRCENGHEFEAFQKMSDDPLDVCPECGGRAERKISPGAGLVFKGSGFYVTDYKRTGEKKAGEADSSDKNTKKTRTDGGAGTAEGSGGKADGGADSGGSPKKD